MLHCGWRGLAGGIIARGADAIQAEAAAIGPGIGPCCYEVGDEVLEAFENLEDVADGRMLDLPKVARQLLDRAGCRADRGLGALHELRCRSSSSPTAATTAAPAARLGSAGSRPELVEPIRDLDPARIARNLAAVREKAGEGVEVLVATKYVPLEEMGALAEAGVGLVGENRAQDLAAKQERWGDAFEWDFIGALQSRKVKQVVPLCRLIHSLASESANRQLERPEAQGARVLVEVECVGRGGQGRDRARRARRVHRRLPGAGRGA